MAVERVQITPDYDWHAARLPFIGASEVATVCRLQGAYKSLAALFAEKKGRVPPQLEDDDPLLVRGRLLEPSVFAALADAFPEWRVAQAKVHLIDRDRRIAATPDGYAQAPDRPGVGLVEAKVVARSAFRRWLEDPEDLDGPATVPERFCAQVVTQMMLEETASWAVLAVLILSEHGIGFRTFDIAPDPALAATITNGVRDFFERYYDPDVMPEYDPAVDEPLIKSLHPTANGNEIDLSTDNRATEATDEWLRTGEQLRQLSKQNDQLRTELKGKIRDFTYARLADGRRLSCKVTNRKAHVVEASTYRTLRIETAKTQHRNFPNQTTGE